jgi:hypothetical protein
MKKERFKPNNYKNASLLYEQYLETIQSGEWILFYTNFMQAGKTGDVECFLRTYFPDLIPNQVIHTTGLADLALKSQSSTRLASCAKVYSATELNNDPSLLNNVKIILIDESQYGVGSDSRIEQLFINISQLSEKPFLIFYGATPFGASVYKAKIVTGQPGDGYRGCFEFFANQQVEDINSWYEDSEDGNSPYFKDIAAEDEDVVLQKGFTTPFERQLTRLDNLENGLAIIRCNDGHGILEQALNNRSKKKGKKYIVLRAHIENGSISNKIEAAIVNCEFERVILIVVGSMNAGNDIGKDAKENLVFVVEPRETVAASQLQGLVGRSCGYHNNTTVKIVCNPDPVTFYGLVQRGSLSWEQLDMNLSTMGLNLATHIHSRTTNPKEYISSESIRININDINTEILKKTLNNLGLDYNREMECINSVVSSYKNKTNKQFKINYKNENIWANGQAQINYQLNPMEFKKHITKASTNTLDFKIFSHRTQNVDSRNKVNRGFLFGDSEYFYYVIRGQIATTARQTLVTDETIYNEYNL